MSENRHSYKADLLDRLKDFQYSQLYLDAAAKESQETLLLALRDVAEAQKGMSQLAEEADVNRENLYRALSEHGDPRLSTINSVLDALGMEWGIARKHRPMATPPRRATISTTTSNLIIGTGTAVNVNAQVTTVKTSEYLLLATKRDVQVEGPQQSPLPVFQGTNTVAA